MGGGQGAEGVLIAAEVRACANGWKAFVATWRAASRLRALLFSAENPILLQKKGKCLRHSPFPTYLSRLLVSFVKKGFTALRRQGILRGILHRIIAHRVARSRALQIG